MKSPLSFLTYEDLAKAIAKRHGKDYKSPWIYEYISKMLGYKPAKGRGVSITRAMFNNIFGSSGSSVDSDAQTFINAASLTGNNATYINTFVLNLKTGLVNGNNLWTDIFMGCAIYPFIGGTAASHAVNLMNPGTFDITFVNSPTHASTGVTFDGSTQYGRTGVVPSTSFDANDFTISVYLKNDINPNTQAFAARSGGSNRNILVARNGSDNLQFHANTGSTSNGMLQVSNSDSSGLITGTRRSSTNVEAYRMASSLGTTATANTGGHATVEFYVGCLNNSGSPASYYGNEFRLAATGKSMTLSQIQDWEAAVTALQTSQGRNV